MEILTTKDYSKFSTINGNRVLNQKKIENLISDIKKVSTYFRTAQL